MRILIYGRFSSHHFAIRNVITSICKGLNETFDFSKNEIIILSNKANEKAFAEMSNLKIDTVDIDPDNALELTNQKFIKRFNYLEDRTLKQGRKLADMTLAEMDEIWEEAKKDL